MPENTNPSSDVLQSHEHQKLTAEQIAKAVARHNKEHKGAPNSAAAQTAKAEKKSGKR